MGQVVEVPIHENEYVRKGDVLFALDRRPFEAALAEAEGKLRQAEQGATLPPGLATEAAGVYNVIRSIGSSIGISIASVYMTRGGQASWSALRSYVDPYRFEVQHYLDPLRLKAQGAGLALIAQQAARRAQMVGLLQAFWLIVASFVAMIPLVMLLKPPRGSTVRAVVPAE